MNKINKNITFSLLLILIVALISIYSLNTQNFFNKSTLIKVPFLKCNPQKQPCNIVTEDFNIKISLDENIFYLKPFNIFAHTESKLNNDIESIQLDFKMKGMNMGINRFILTQKVINDKNREWQGKALLPICIARRADWFAELEVVTNQKKYILSFPVDIKQAGI